MSHWLGGSLELFLDGRLEVFDNRGDGRGRKFRLEELDAVAKCRFFVRPDRNATDDFASNESILTGEIDGKPDVLVRFVFDERDEVETGGAEVGNRNHARHSIPLFKHGIVVQWVRHGCQFGLEVTHKAGESSLVTVGAASEGEPCHF